MVNSHIRRSELQEIRKMSECLGYNKRKCPGPIHTILDNVVKSIPHNHVADAAELQAKTVLYTMKESANIGYNFARNSTPNSSWNNFPIISFQKMTSFECRK